MAASSVCFWWAVSISAALVAPVERRGGLATLARLRIVGAAVCGAPAPVVEWWRPRLLKISEVRLQVTKLASPFAAQGGGAQAPRSVDFLLASGFLPVQAYGGEATGFAVVASCSAETTTGLGWVTM
jgi:hypothetical protein